MKESLGQGFLKKEEKLWQKKQNHMITLGLAEL